MLVVFSRKQMLQFDRMHSTDLWLFLVIRFKIDRTDYQLERNNRKLNNLTQCRQQIIGSNLVPGSLFVTSPGSPHSLTLTSPEKSNLSRLGLFWIHSCISDKPPIFWPSKQRSDWFMLEIAT